VAIGKEQAMGKETSTDRTEDGEQPPAGRESYVPKPPSPEAVEQISRDQALITDEWSGDEPGAGEPPRGRPGPGGS
jgi:hypothetical protein